MNKIKQFIIKIAPASIKFIITILSILLFCWISKECYIKDTAGSIILIWLGIVIFLNLLWKYNIRWPRGKYNGYRIDGFDLKFKLHLLSWHFKPSFRWNFGQPYFLWFCFSVLSEISYKLNSGVE